MERLTREERERFASWLEREAEQDRETIENLGRLPSTPVTRVLVTQYEQDASAAEHVAKKLRSITEATVQ